MDFLDIIAVFGGLACVILLVVAVFDHWRDRRKAKRLNDQWAKFVERERRDKARADEQLSKPIEWPDDGLSLDKLVVKHECNITTVAEKDA